jgi:hypothetical protein
MVERVLRIEKSVWVSVVRCLLGIVIPVLMFVAVIDELESIGFVKRLR